MRARPIDVSLAWWFDGVRGLRTVPGYASSTPGLYVHRVPESALSDESTPVQLGDTWQITNGKGLLVFSGFASRALALAVADALAEVRIDWRRVHSNRRAMAWLPQARDVMTRTLARERRRRRARAS